jgi:hypothetical protein
MPTSKKSYRWFVAITLGNVLWVTVITGAIFQDRANDKRILAERRHDNCIQTLARDETYESIDRAIWTKLASGATVSPEGQAIVQDLLEFISEEYNAIPPPATCT